MSVRISGISSVFMATDFAFNLKEENVGRASVHTAVTTVATTMTVQGVTTGMVALSAGSGLLASSSALATGFIASNPVGWAIAASIGIGFAVGLAYDKNFLGIKDMANDIGDSINDGLDTIGQVVHSGWESLKSVFGW